MAPVQTQKRVCIVSSMHISANPRVVKEADALAEAGYEVHVCAVQNHAAYAELDAKMLVTRNWKLSTVALANRTISEKITWFTTGCRQKFFTKCLYPLTAGKGIAERAEGRVYDELLRLSRRVPADLYIAHHADALGSAYHAAQANNGIFAFDAEDFHQGEASADGDTTKPTRTAYLEQKYLPRCKYVSASSANIAQALADRYAISKPEVILNVFPIEDSPISEDAEATPDRASLYWYSQVVGPGRGLEDAAVALGKLDLPCQLHIRGRIAPGFDDKLRELAGDPAVSDRIIFHPHAHPDELIALAGKHHIGLALETGKDANNLLAASNKLFVYLLAGLAVVASDTPGQSTIMNQISGAGVTCKMRDADSLADAINTLIANPQTLADAMRCSRRAAEEKFNWEIEKTKLLTLVESVLRDEPQRTQRFAED